MILIFDKEYYKPSTYQIPAIDQDTIFLSVILKEKFKEFEEVTIVHEKLKKVSGELNEHIIDYLLLADRTVSLIKKTI